MTRSVALHQETTEAEHRRRDLRRFIFKSAMGGELGLFKVVL